jgi:hypothetical protein
MSNEHKIFQYQSEIVELQKELSRTWKIRILKRIFLKICIMDLQNEVIYLKALRDR